MSDILKRLAKALPQNVDAALIESDVNRRYLTGMKSSAGTLLVTSEGSYLVIDFRYFENHIMIMTNSTYIIANFKHLTTIIKYSKYLKKCF